MMKLSNWMMMELMPRVEDADQYIIGQSLTKKQAKDIMKIVARSIDFDLKNPSTREKLNYIGSPYRDFIVCYMHLVIAGKGAGSNWKDALMGVLNTTDYAAVVEVAHQFMTGNLPRNFYC